MNWKDLNRLYSNKICSDYTSGKSLKDLAFEYYGTASTSGIKKILSLNNVKLRTNSEYIAVAHSKHSNEVGYCGRKYSLNNKYFGSWTSKMAYILGFIYADGNIYGNNLLTIGLKREDKEILEKIKLELGYDGDIKDKTVKLNKKDCETSILSFRSKDIVESLRNLGISENKSLTINFPNVPKEYELDFIRGYFDGDGCIGIQYPKSKRAETKTCQIRVRFCSGSENFIKSIRDTLVNYGVKEVNITTRNNVNIFEICYSTKDSLKLYELFYNENCMFLKRKKDRFDEAIKIRKSDILSSTGNIKVKM